MRNCKIMRKLIAVLASCASFNVYAEFVVDNNFKSLLTAQSSVLDRGSSRIIDARDGLIEKEGGHPSVGSIATARIIWNKSIYFITGADYITKNQINEIKSAVAERRKTIAFANGGVCEIFLFDSDVNLLARKRIALPMANGGSVCNDGSRAIARASPHDTAVLYSLTYYQLNAPIAKRPQDIGNDWIESTYLIRLKKRADGMVYLEQDDSCLGNPNHYATIAAARKALARCAGQGRN